MSMFRLSIRLVSRQSGACAGMKSSSTAIGVGTARYFSGLQHQLNMNPAMSSPMEWRRHLTTHDLTKNMQIFSGNTQKMEVDSKTLVLKKPTDRPLVVMLAWLQAKQKHLAKYAQLYVDQGFDVLTVQITPWQLLWPGKGTQLVAGDLVRFLVNNPSIAPLLLHGFSVGGYMWGECMVHIARDTQKYKPVLDRIVGQVWDSAADITEIPIGVPKALFPRNKTLENTLRQYMNYHMKTFRESTQCYIRSSQMFHSNMVHTPALFLLSKSDPVGAEGSNQRVRESWESMGVKVTWKCWDRSPHVGHFQKHPDEYLDFLWSHLRSINLIAQPNVLRAKL